MDTRSQSHEIIRKKEEEEGRKAKRKRKTKQNARDVLERHRRTKRKIVREKIKLKFKIRRQDKEMTS